MIVSHKLEELERRNLDLKCSLVNRYWLHRTLLLRYYAPLARMRACRTAIMPREASVVDRLGADFYCLIVMQAGLAKTSYY